MDDDARRGLQMSRRASPAIAEPVLRVTDVRKSFGHGTLHRRRVDVLRGASLEVGPGELVGSVGENGSGKTVLMKIIVGLLRRDAGEIERGGRLGYCPQEPLVWEKLTVAEHFGLFAQAYSMTGPEAEAARGRDCSMSCSSPATPAIGSRTSRAARARS